MKNWGVIITAFYIAVVACLMPSVLLILIPEVALSEIYQEWFVWLWVSILILGQIILLSVRVDTTKKVFKPRRHILVSVLSIAFSASLLTIAVVTSIAAAIFGDEVFELHETYQVLHFLSEAPELFILSPIFGFWIFWSFIFFKYARHIFDRNSQIYNWLIRGSVVELLVAVPSHVIVHQREECSAPSLTAFGVATGLAIMFMSFGPAILFLYRERMRIYEQSQNHSEQEE
jgi:hypothetical protein